MWVWIDVVGVEAPRSATPAPHLPLQLCCWLLSGRGGGAPGSLLLSKLINSSSCSTLVHQSITPNALTRRSAMQTMALAFATASLASYLPPYHETRAMF